MKQGRHINLRPEAGRALGPVELAQWGAWQTGASITRGAWAVPVSLESSRRHLAREVTQVRRRGQVVIYAHTIGLDSSPRKLLGQISELAARTAVDLVRWGP